MNAKCEPNQIDETLILVVKSHLQNEKDESFRFPLSYSVFHRFNISSKNFVITENRERTQQTKPNDENVKNQCEKKKNLTQIFNYNNSGSIMSYVEGSLLTNSIFANASTKVLFSIAFRQRFLFIIPSINSTWIANIIIEHAFSLPNIKFDTFRWCNHIWKHLGAAVKHC